MIDTPKAVKGSGRAQCGDMVLLSNKNECKGGVAKHGNVCMRVISNKNECICAEI